ncbi:protein SPMIP2-like [Corticium candelabrum]|uniref:protein SPMIP2-like n=1 Tax=Corticium candelabrum TaxID=121492 RepID=UPI002E2695D4|nr:protein SPMIP2-like [Corticium candelabrum]
MRSVATTGVGICTVQTRFCFLCYLQVIVSMSTTMSDVLAQSPDGSRLGKGQVLFTGPDGIGNYTVNVKEQSSIGIGTMSPEGTSDVRYLSRAGPNCTHPPAKSYYVGEVGWGVPKLSDPTPWTTKHQMTLGELRQAAEDKHTHLYQNPWYPAPERNHAKDTVEKTKPSIVRPTKAATTEVEREGSVQSSSSSVALQV